MINSGTFSTGDCFRVVYDQPYSYSKTFYGGTDFYVPFPAANTYSLTTSTPSAGVMRVDDHTLEITLTAGGTTSYNFDVASMTNPYSQT